MELYEVANELESIAIETGSEIAWEAVRFIERSIERLQKETAAHEV